MIGILGNLAKKPLSKPKTPKVQPPKDEGGKDAAKTKPKGQLVPSPGGAIVKIISVPAPVKKDVLVGDDPALMQMQAINNRTFDILKALKADQKAKKKKATAKKNLFSWFQRKQREEDREAKSGEALKVPGMGKISGGIGNLFGNILKVLGLLFAGWLMNYLPQIIKAVRGFLDFVGKVINFIRPIAQFIWDVGKWIVGAGTKLAAMLVGVKPSDAMNNSIIKNLNEIQKRFPLLESAMAAFLVFQGVKGFNRLKNLGKPPKIKKLTAKQRLGRRVTSKIGRNVKKQVKDVGKLVPKGVRSRVRLARKSLLPARKVAQGAQSVMKRGPGRVVKRGLILASKKTGMTIFKKAARFAKIPIIGPLIVAVTQLLSGEPLGKALFMGVGAGLGGVLGGMLAGALGVATVGFGAVLAPLMVIIGEGIGTFIGELLYDGFLGKGWGAAGSKLKKRIGDMLKGTAEIFKSIWNWLKGGGLVELAKKIGGGIMAIPGLLGAAFNKAKETSEDIGKWLAESFGRFITGFMEKHSFQLPGLGLLKRTPGLPKWIKEWDGKIPNMFQLMNPLAMWPLLFESFFPQKAAAMAEKKAAVERGDVAKKNIFGKELSDEHQSEEYLKKRDSGQLPASKNADAISESASYDAPAGGTDTVIVNSGGGSVSGGGGGSSTPTIIGGDDFYKAALLNRKKSNLAKVWA